MSVALEWERLGLLLLGGVFGEACLRTGLLSLRCWCFGFAALLGTHLITSLYIYFLLYYNCRGCQCCAAAALCPNPLMCRTCTLENLLSKLGLVESMATNFSLLNAT